jgi:putative transposase
MRGTPLFSRVVFEKTPWYELIMPRRARIDAPGALHHVICRGIERRKIFWGDSDRDDFRERLETILRETQTACYAWAMLPNHFHLLLRIGNTPIAGVMRQLLSGYAGKFNRFYAIGPSTV